MSFIGWPPLGDLVYIGMVYSKISCGSFVEARNQSDEPCCRNRNSLFRRMMRATHETARPVNGRGRRARGQVRARADGRPCTLSMVYEGQSIPGFRVK